MNIGQNLALIPSQKLMKLLILVAMHWVSKNAHFELSGWFA